MAAMYELAYTLVRGKDFRISLEPEAHTSGRVVLLKPAAVEQSWHTVENPGSGRPRATDAVQKRKTARQAEDFSAKSLHFSMRCIRRVLSLSAKARSAAKSGQNLLVIRAAGYPVLLAP
jgi:hypothetical protein